MSDQKINIQLCQTITASGETVRYQTIKLPVSARKIHLEGCTDAAVLQQLKRLTEKHLLPNNKNWKSVFLFNAAASRNPPFPDRDGNLVIIDSVARTRYWLEKLRDNNSRWLERSSASLFVNELLDTGQGLMGGASDEKIFIVPVYPGMTRLSEHYDPGRITINTHFFLMELTDLLTPWDVMGEPFGLRILNGKVELPPLYGRDVLLWSREKGCVIDSMDVRDNIVLLNHVKMEHGGNAFFFTRPDYEVTPVQPGTDWVIVGRRVLARKYGGGTPVPEAGFVCHVNGKSDDLPVSAEFLTDAEWDFGIQGGTAMVKNGEKCSEVPFPFYNGKGIHYPPTVYPQDWSNDRAARTGLGINGDRMVLICVEGSKEHLYRHGEDSTGVSLKEFADLVMETGTPDFINLDGGGSAQLSVYGKRSLKLSDRHSTGMDFERPVPAGMGFETL